MSNRDEIPLHTHRGTQDCHPACPGYSPPVEPVADADPISPEDTVFAGTRVGTEEIEQDVPPPVDPEGRADGGAHGDNLNAQPPEGYTGETISEMQVETPLPPIMQQFDFTGSPLPEKLRSITEKVAADLNAKIRERLAAEDARAAGFATEPVGVAGEIVEDDEGIRIPMILFYDEADGAPSHLEVMTTLYNDLFEKASEHAGEIVRHDHEVGEYCVEPCPVYRELVANYDEGHAEHYTATVATLASGAGMLIIPEMMKCDEHDPGEDDQAACAAAWCEACQQYEAANDAIEAGRQADIEGLVRQCDEARRRASDEAKRREAAERRSDSFKQRIVDLEAANSELRRARADWQRLTEEGLQESERLKTALQQALERVEDREAAELGKAPARIWGGLTVDGLHIPATRMVEGFTIDPRFGFVTVKLLAKGDVVLHYGRDEE